MVSRSGVALTVAIVGGGPRGMGLLERLVSRFDKSGPPCDVHVIEPREPGPGMHSAEQPPYLLLNTVCSQLTGFTEPAMLRVSGRSVEGPSLYEWVRQRNHLVDGRSPEPTDHLPRRLLGSYLSWAAERVRSTAPPRLRIHEHRASAVATVPDGEGERLTLSDGSELVVDRVVIATGHCTTGPYPLPAAVEHVRPGSTVIVRGAGLTAMDVLAALTIGRGGRFDSDRDELRYVSSGHEPNVVLTTRTGMPARARPRLAAGRKSLPARHLSAEAITALRAGRADHKLDFRTDVLPLVYAEMAYRWQYYTDRADRAHRRERAPGPPDFDGLLFATPPGAALADVAAYRNWYRQEIEDDLRCARRGLGVDPLKESLEVLRDHRSVIRAAVDHDGLTDESRTWFYAEYAPAANRAVIGPQLERHAELLAMLAAGVVVAGPGPAALCATSAGQRMTVASTALSTPCSVSADDIVDAFQQPVEPVASEQPLIAGLATQGRVSVVRAGSMPVGLRVDRSHRLLDPAGAPSRTLMAFGPLTEGSTYYNHYVATPGAPSRATEDADEIARDLLRALAPDAVGTRQETHV